MTELIKSIEKCIDLSSDISKLSQPLNNQSLNLKITELIRNLEFSKEKIEKLKREFRNIKKDL